MYYHIHGLLPDQSFLYGFQTFHTNSNLWWKILSGIELPSKPKQRAKILAFLGKSQWILIITFDVKLPIVRYFHIRNLFSMMRQVLLLRCEHNLISSKNLLKGIWCPNISHSCVIEWHLSILYTNGSPDYSHERRKQTLMKMTNCLLLYKTFQWCVVRHFLWYD